MVRQCCIKNCVSGSSSHRKERNSNGLRQLTLFKAPKNEERILECSQSMGQTVKDNHYVCELHFFDDDIKRFDVIQTSGVTFSIPLAVWRLTHNKVTPTVKESLINQNLRPCPAATSLSKMIPGTEKILETATDVPNERNSNHVFENLHTSSVRLSTEPRNEMILSQLSQQDQQSSKSTMSCFENQEETLVVGVAAPNQNTELPNSQILTHRSSSTHFRRISSNDIKEPFT